MENKDIRLYYYSSGVLHKTRVHKFVSEEDARKYVKGTRERRQDKLQYIITEYSASYESMIIGIINPEI